MPYLSPSKMWRVARPGSIPLSSWEPGTLSAVTKTGTGSGTIAVSGYPLDAYTVKLRVSTAGEPGTAKIRVALDGTTFGQPMLVPDADGMPLIVAGEVVLTFTAGAAPSFALNDEHSFTTGASPEIVAAIEAAGQEADCYFRDVWALPLSAWDAAVERNVGLLACDLLTCNRGFAEADKFAACRKTAEKWLTAVARGDIQPLVTEGPGGGFVFPTLIKTSTKYATDWRT